MSLFFVTCAKNLEGLLREELIALGASSIKETVAGVYFEGELEDAYRVCLWSRLANHVLLRLAQFEAPDNQSLYRAVQRIQWEYHLDVEGTLSIEVTGQHPTMNHSLFIAQRVKDAIVDQFRDYTGQRPSVENSRPDILLNLHIHDTLCTLSLSLSGESLHRRGYRLESGKAPLKETLAAAILLRAGWPKYLAQPNPTLLDPMCGTGTLLIEAALMAFDIAPGLEREYFGFLGWRQHSPEIWGNLKKEARERKNKGLANQNIIITGSDIHKHAIEKSLENIASADLSDRISVRSLDCSLITPPTNKDSGEAIQTGLVICNPPYGDRMNTEDYEFLKILFKDFGTALKTHFIGWHLALFSGAPKECNQAIGLRAKRFYPLFNGTLPCHVFLFDIQPERFAHRERNQDLKLPDLKLVDNHDQENN